MIGEVVVPEDRLACRVAVLHGVFNPLRIPVRLWNPIRTDLSVSIAEVSRNTDESFRVTILAHVVLLFTTTV
jgi:hypothetical protein